jgi:DNA polymerase-3 subunit alpha
LVVGRSSLRAIRFGLAAIKNVGEGAVKVILEARHDRPFVNLDDFCHRVDLRQVNRRGLECLIKAGALDCFGKRSQLLEVVDRMLAVSQQSHQAQDVGQMSLFEAGGLGPGGNGSHQTFDRLPDVPDVPPKELLAWEKELLGAYLSEHPLHRLAGQVQDTITALCGQIDATLAGQKVIVAGMVSGTRVITTKKGETMAFVQLEDLQSGVEVTVFPRVYAQTSGLWAEDNLVVVTGKVDERGGKVSIIADSAVEYVAEGRPTTNDQRPTTKEPGRSSPGHHLLVTLPRSTDQEQDIVRLGQVYDLLASYQGTDRFSLFVSQGVRRVQVDFPNTTTRYCVGLVNRLEEMLGPGAVRVNSLQ